MREEKKNIGEIMGSIRCYSHTNTKYMPVILIFLICFIISCTSREVKTAVNRTWPFSTEEAKRLQQETAKRLGIPVEKTIDLGNNVNMVFVLIPAGTYRSDPKMDHLVLGFVKDKPIRNFMIYQPFYMAKNETTMKQWFAVEDKKSGYFRMLEDAYREKQQNVYKYHTYAKNAYTTDDINELRPLTRPVELVSWDYCNWYTQKISEKTGCTVRLPTDTEWEWACRAGSDAAYGYSDKKEDLKGFAEDLHAGTRPVGMLKPNTWGLYDMYDNIYEWTGNIRMQAAGDIYGRVVKGGFWGNGPEPCSSCYVYPRSSCGILGTGCRFVMEIPISEEKKKQKILHMIQGKSREELDDYLYEASRNNDELLIRLLIQAGADPNKYYFSISWSSMDFIAYRGSFQSFKSAIMANKDILITRRKNDPSVFMLALRSWTDSEKKIDLILELAGNKKGLIKDIDAALDAAAEKGNKKIVELLLEKGADISYRDSYKRTPLMEAARCNSPDTVRVLISKGSDVNATGRDGDTALMFAVLGARYVSPDQCAATLKELIKAGADVSIKNKKGMTPYQVAVKESMDSKIIKVLREARKNKP